MSSDEVRLDLARGARIGLEEAIYCAHKSTAQIEQVLDRLAAAGRGGLFTRLDAAQHTALAPTWRAQLDYDAVSRTAYFAWQAKAAAAPRVALVTAGSSDVPVAREAARTLAYFHVASHALFDAGVAGLWRLLDNLDGIRDLPVCIVAAGMDAALPSVLGGLYPGLLIAVPTSVGYGVAADGRTALHTILASCAPGIVTVNIDNGYGAACAALRALRAAPHPI